MSISAIVTRGYSFDTGLVVTAGYTPSSTGPPPPVPDLPADCIPFRAVVLPVGDARSTAAFTLQSRSTTVSTMNARGTATPTAQARSVTVSSSAPRSNARPQDCQNDA